jgi:hypothetical protein
MRSNMNISDEHANELFDLLTRLLDCPELDRQDLEPETEELVSEAYDLKERVIAAANA